MARESRGIRNRNPGNIRISATHWRGKLDPSQDPAFETFDTAEHGIRAICKILLSYADRYGLRTIQQIITRWAPPSENNTEAYIENVEDRTGLDRSLQFDLDSPFILAKLVQAIIHQENGVCPYTNEQITDAVQMALPIPVTTNHGA